MMKKYSRMSASEQIDCNAILDTIIKNYTSNIDEAIEIIENGDYMVFWDCNSISDVMQRYCDELALFSEMPDTFKRYFDFEAFGKEMGYTKNLFKLSWFDCGYIQICRN